MDDGRGVYIGLSDKFGRRVHIGDTLRYDPAEYGAECEFVIKIEGGQLVYPGAPSDIPGMAVLVRRWDSGPLSLEEAGAQMVRRREELILNAIDGCGMPSLSDQESRSLVQVTRGCVWRLLVVYFNVLRGGYIGGPTGYQYTRDLAERAAQEAVSFTSFPLDNVPPAERDRYGR